MSKGRSRLGKLSLPDERVSPLSRLAGYRSAEISLLCHIKLTINFDLNSAVKSVKQVNELKLLMNDLLLAWIRMLYVSARLTDTDQRGKGDYRSLFH